MTDGARRSAVQLSGLSEAQYRLVKLLGAIEALEMPLAHAVAVLDTPGPDSHAELADYLKRFQLGLLRVTGRVSESVWPSASGPLGGTS